MTMGFDSARHILLRTSFGGTPSVIADYSRLDTRLAVARLLDGVHADAVTAPPDWVAEAPPSREERRDNRMEFQRLFRRRGEELKAWWYREMIATESPLTERLVLFWHNHFTSSLRRVRFPPFMYRQNALFRRLATGSFRDLLHEITRDPAMVIYLDTQTNDREHPNENFARELLELFTMGEGHYTEEDIRDAARAFTGLRLNRNSGEIHLARRRHDFGRKTFLGRTGHFDADDIIDIILDQERTALHIVEKLWRAFVSPDAENEEVRALASLFRDSDYELRPLLAALFESSSFFAQANRGTLIKSPVDLIVGTVRSLDLTIEDHDELVRCGRRMTQDVFAPPNVKGWPGGTAWITSASLLQRQSILRGAARSETMRDRLGPAGLASWLTADTTAADLPRHLLATDPVGVIDASANIQELAESVLLDPAYQLK
jgi:uncharacterized protein (DUF1800 family)